jgi:hypothetical protein
MDTSTASPATTGASGNWFTDVTSNLLKLVDQGAQVYNSINNKTQGAATQVSGSQAAGATTSGSVFGLTKKELLLIGGGVALIAILLIIRKR